MELPKILHLYWEERPMSYLQTLTVETFHRKNPGWEIQVHIPLQKENSPAKYIPDYVGVDYFPEIRKLKYVNIIYEDLKKYGIDEKLHNILRSDILRYHLLYNVGGVWSDFDVLWLKSMEYLNKIPVVGSVRVSDMGFSVCQFHGTSGFHSIGVMMAKAGNPFFQNLITLCNRIQNQARWKHKLAHQVFGPTLLTRIFPNLETLEKQYKDVVGFPYKTFYPYSIFSLDLLYKQKDMSYVDEEVMAVHWFNGHSLSKAYIHNGYKEDCSMTVLLNLIKKGLL